MKLGRGRCLLKPYEARNAWMDFCVLPLGKRNSPESIVKTFLYLSSQFPDELDELRTWVRQPVTNVHS